MKSGAQGTRSDKPSAAHHYFLPTDRSLASTHIAAAASWVACLLILVVAGCGKKGPPLPRDLVTPDVVTDLSIEGRAEGFLISWRNPDKDSQGKPLRDLKGFKLYKKQDSPNCKSCPSDFPVYMDIDLSSPEGINVEKGITSLLDTEVGEGIIYRYKAAPYNSAGYAGAFSDVKIARWRKPLPKIGHLKSWAGDRSVKLAWKAFDSREDDGFAGYRVYRTEVSGNYKRWPLIRVPLQEAGYADIGLENNRHYYYIVSALSLAGETLIEGAASDEVLAVPLDMMPPGRPQSVMAVATDRGVSLSWDMGSENDMAGYYIYKKASGGLAMERLNMSPERANYYLDADVLPGKSYVYSVTAVDGSPQHNESSPSSEVTVKMPD